jgi:hypothetical protein
MDQFKGYVGSIRLRSAEKLIVNKADNGHVIVIEYETHRTILTSTESISNRRLHAQCQGIGLPHGEPAFFDNRGAHADQQLVFAHRQIPGTRRLVDTFSSQLLYGVGNKQ